MGQNESVRNRRGTRFSVGDSVCLSKYSAVYPGRREVATVVSILDGRYHQGVAVRPKLEGIRCWNVNELVIARGVPKEECVRGNR